VQPRKAGLLRQYSEHQEEPFLGIRYWNMQGRSPLWRLIRPDRRDLWSISLMTINISIPPHTDSGARTVINCYGATAAARTQFYRAHPHTRQRQVRNQTTGYIYDPTTVVETAGFEAEPGDCWMLSVEQIHGVSARSAEERWAVCLSTPQTMARAREDLA
jgi:hypothetical protein